MINLCECKPGDCLIAEDNSLFFYYKYRPSPSTAPYRHYIKRRLKYYTVWSVTDGGKHDAYEDCGIDIIKIIPQETPNFYFTTYEYLRLYKRTSEIA
jgi:hypothetical protein